MKEENRNILERYDSEVKKYEETIENLEQELKQKIQTIEKLENEPLLNKFGISGDKQALQSESLLKLVAKYEEKAKELKNQVIQNQRLTAYLENIQKTLEQKAPIIEAQKKEYQQAIIDKEKLASLLENSLLQIEQLKIQLSTFSIENRTLNTQTEDLSRQIQLLLKENQTLSNLVPVNILNNASRTGSPSPKADGTYLFKNIKELQETNARLQRELSSYHDKQEEINQNKFGKALDELKQLKLLLNENEKKLKNMENLKNHYQLLHEKSTLEGKDGKTLGEFLKNFQEQTIVTKAQTATLKKEWLAKHEKTLNQVTAEKQNLQQVLQTLKNENATQQAKIQDLTAILSSTKEQMKELNQEKMKYFEMKVTAEEKMASKEREYERGKQEQENQRAILQMLDSEKTNIERNLISVQGRIPAFENEINKLKGELKQTREENQKEKGKNQRMKAKIKAEKQRNEKEKEITEQRRKESEENYEKKLKENLEKLEFSKLREKDLSEQIERENYRMKETISEKQRLKEEIKFKILENEEISEKLRESEKRINLLLKSNEITSYTGMFDREGETQVDLKLKWNNAKTEIEILNENLQKQKEEFEEIYKIQNEQIQLKENEFKNKQARFESEAGRLRETIAALTEEKTQNLAKISEQKNKIEQLENEIERYAGELRLQNEEKEILKNKIKNILENEKKLLAELDALRAENRLFQENLQEEKRKLQEEIQKNQEEKQRESEKVKNQENEQVEKMKKFYESKYDILKDQNELLTNEIESLRIKIAFYGKLFDSSTSNPYSFSQNLSNNAENRGNGPEVSESDKINELKKILAEIQSEKESLMHHSSEIKQEKLILSKENEYLKILLHETRINLEKLQTSENHERFEKAATDLKVIEESNLKLRKEKENLQIKCDKQSKQIDGFKKQLEQINELKTVSEKNQILNKENQKLKESIKQFTTARDQKSADMQADNNRLKGKIQELKTENQELQNENQRLKTENQELKNKIKENENKIAELTTSLQQETEQKNQLERKNQEQSIAATAAAEKIAQLRKLTNLYRKKVANKPEQLPADNSPAPPFVNPADHSPVPPVEADHPPPSPLVHETPTANEGEANQEAGDKPLPKPGVKRLRDASQQGSAVASKKQKPLGKDILDRLSAVVPDSSNS